MQTGEHILLESEAREVPDPRYSRRLHGRIDVHSRLRRKSLQLELIEYYYLVVRLYRSHSLSAEYVLDLRFVDSSLEFSRRIASRWILTTLALVALATGIALRIQSAPVPNDWLLACVVVCGMTIGAALVCLYRTTETVELYSSHGRARLLTFTSGIGAVRALKPFRAKIAAHIRLATAARRPLKWQHLRDEMREHFRLRETGVLSEDEYERSKGHILSGHSARSRPNSWQPSGYPRSSQP
jgi:hypothetical protein